MTLYDFEANNFRSNSIIPINILEIPNQRASGQSLFINMNWQTSRLYYIVTHPIRVHRHIRPPSLSAQPPPPLDMIDV